MKVATWGILSALLSMGASCTGMLIDDHISAHLQDVPVASVTYNGERFECHLLGYKPDFSLLLVPYKKMSNNLLKIFYADGNFHFTTEPRNTVDSKDTIPAPFLGCKKFAAQHYTMREDSTSNRLVLPADSPVLNYAYALDVERRFDFIPQADKKALRARGYNEEEMKNFLTGWQPRSSRSGGTQGYYVTQAEGKNLALWVVSGYVEEGRRIRHEHVSSVKALPDGVYLIDPQTRVLRPAEGRLPGIRFSEEDPTGRETYQNCVLGYGREQLVFDWPAREYTDSATGKECYAFRGGVLYQAKDAVQSLEDGGSDYKTKQEEEAISRGRRNNLMGLAGSGAVALASYFWLRKRAARLTEVEEAMQELAEQGEEIPAELSEEAASLRRWQGLLRLGTGAGGILAAFFLAQLAARSSSEKPKVPRERLE